MKVQGKLITNLLVIYFIGVIISFSGCVLTKEKSNDFTSNNVSYNSQPDYSKARALSDSLVNNLINNQRKDIRGKIEKDFREATTEEQFDLILDQLFEKYGMPVECQYKKDEFGSKIYLDGQEKPLLKFWYACRTTMHEKGSHFLFVEVVPDNENLAISSFAIVTFQQGIPPSLD